MPQREKIEDDDEEAAAVDYEWHQFEKAMREANSRRRAYYPRAGLLFLTVPFLLLVLILLCLGLAAGRTKTGSYNGTDSLSEDYSVDYNETLLANNPSTEETKAVVPPLQGSIIEVPVCPGNMKRIHGKCRKVIKVTNSAH